MERVQTFLQRRGTTNARRSAASHGGAGRGGSVASFRETFRHRQRSGSAEFIFSEIRNAFNPNSRLIQTWNQVILFCILYELFILPYLITFDTHMDAAVEETSTISSASQRVLVVLYACELVFCFDIYVQLNTGYYEDGDILRDTRKSRLKYLKSWAFVLDVAALPPLSLLLVPSLKLSISHLSSAVGAHRALLELHKLLRIRRLPKLISKLDDIYARYFELLKLAKVLATTLLVSHLVACGRFAFGYDAHHTNHWLPPEPSHGEPHHTSMRRYLMSLFWAFGLLTGLFEGELPHTGIEFVFTITVALCGFSLFTYLCATFFMLSKCEGGETETAEARVNQFKHLLAFHRVPDDLQQQAVEYLKRYYAQVESNDREASKLLCPSITVDIQIEILQETVASVPIFRGCDAKFIKAVTSLLDMVSYPAQFVLFRAGDHGDAMYVIHSGVINTLVNGVKVRELRKGSFFGEVAVFAHIPRSATMMTTTYCTLYRLSRFHAEKLVQGYPRYAKLISQTVEGMLNVISTAPQKNEDENNKTTTSASATTTPTDSPQRRLTASLIQAVGLRRASSRKQSQLATSVSSRVAPQIDSSVADRSTVPVSSSETATVAPQTPKPTAVVAPSPSASVEAVRRPSAARHSSSRHVISSKVVPEASLSPNSRVRRSNTGLGNLKGGMSFKHETLAGRSRSQLELLKNNLIRISRGSIESMRPDAMKGFYDQIQRLASPTSNKARWWSKFLLTKCLHAESKLRMVWLLVLQLDLCYNWIAVPLQLAFPLFDRPRWYISALNLVVDIVLWIDMYINLNLSFSINSETIMDTKRSAERYFKSGHLLADVICAFPYKMFIRRVLPVNSIATTWAVDHAVLRIPRLLRVWRVRGHFSEVEEYLVLKSKQRLMFLGFVLVMLYHIVACLHFATTYWEGFSPKEDAWIPSDDIELYQVNSSTFMDAHGVFHATDTSEVSSIQAKQYFRSLYYATNVLAALGRTIEPSSDRQYGIALLFMLNGFLITAIVVDNVQKRFTASALEQKEFFATRARIQLFLKRQDAPLAIHQRVNSFLDYWWSSHRGAIIGELLEELPETIKRNIVRSICKPAVESIGMLFPQIWTEENGQAAHMPMGSIRRQIEEIFVDNLKFVLYGQGEVIYRKGDYPSGLYFLLEGQICVETGKEPPRRIPLGGYFGTATLDDNDTDSNNSKQAPRGHTEQVTAQSGCVVVYVSREHLRVMQVVFPALSSSLLGMEKRAMVALRVTRAGVMESGVTKTIRPGASHTALHPTWMSQKLQAIQQTRLWMYASGEKCFDPDSVFIGYWEMWVFAAMTTQCTLVIYHTCFGVATGSGTTNVRGFVLMDAVMVFLEACFLLDMFIRTRLGFYEYGNKVMSLRHIKVHYMGSKYFMIDLIALLPAFLFNWFSFGSSSTGRRLEILNLNKLLRLFKSSTQFRALESKYVKLTMELRLFRLVYYTFLASHTFGCIWFDFAARLSGLHDSSTPVFGLYKWLPYTSLETASRSKQYFASVFWAFGLMTASSPGELPKTVSQCFFSVVTMTAGFFLFAYVVGNFLDVIELQDSENRHFIAKLSSLRHLLKHFKLPNGIEAKFKTYFFFKRFHSITQEHVLERVLPPSLVIDIRMFQLQPMIVKVAFLAGMEDSVTRMLVSQFTQMLVVKDMYICKFGEEGKEMFFIFTGVLDIYVPLPPSAKAAGGPTASTIAPPPSQPATSSSDDAVLSGFHKVNQITAGNYFGEAALFTKAPRNAYVKARTSCILYRLSRESLELVFERFPEWKEKVLRIVKIQQEQQRLMRLAAEAQAVDSGGGGSGAGGPNGSGGKRRGLKKTMSRIDLINSRAEDMEELVLANTRGGRGSKFSPAEWLHKKATPVVLVRKAFEPTLRQLSKWVSLLVHGAEVQSAFYLFWLRLVTFCTVYVAILTPYRCAYDDLDRWNALPVLARIVEELCEIVFWLDIWFHFRIKDSLAAMELYEQDHLQAYKRERFLWDLVAALPLDHFVVDQMIGYKRATVQKWLRLNRCFKVANLAYYRLEVNRRSVTYELNKLVTLWMLYLLAMYWTSCAYIAVAMQESFGDTWQAWLPHEELYQTDHADVLILRLFRGFFFAVTAFVKKGRTFVPTQTLDYGFSIVLCFIGQLIMALMIGEVASIFILYIDNEVEFRKSHISLELFLSRKKLTPALKERCSAFLTSWWSSHAGVNYQVLFEELPATVRTEGVTYIAQKPLTKLMDRVFRPLTGVGPRGVAGRGRMLNPNGGSSGSGGGDSDPLSLSSSFAMADEAAAHEIDANGHVTVENLMHSIAQHLHFEGYPRGENVVVEGTVGRAVFFVVKGYLYSKSVSNPKLYHAGRFRMGDYFGEKGLLGQSVSLMTVSTIRACDLFVLRSEHLLEAINSHPYFSVLFRMAQEVVHKKQTIEEYFADSINSDRREMLRRRLTTPPLSHAPPSLRNLYRNSSRSVLPAAGAGSSTGKNADDAVQRILEQSSRMEWDDAFQLFLELLVPKGTLSVVDSGDEEEGGHGKNKTTQEQDAERGDDQVEEGDEEEEKAAAEEESAVPLVTATAAGRVSSFVSSVTNSLTSSLGLASHRSGRSDDGGDSNMANEARTRPIHPNHNHTRLAPLPPLDRTSRPQQM